MPIDDVLRMAGHCQRADYAHSQGIIHRDINRQCVDRKNGRVCLILARAGCVRLDGEHFRYTSLHFARAGPPFG